jgi:hypothetical protein
LLKGPQQKFAAVDFLGADVCVLLQLPPFRICEEKEGWGCKGKEDIFAEGIIARVRRKGGAKDGVTVVGSIPYLSLMIY